MISDFLNYIRRKTAVYSTAGVLALIIAGLIFLIWPQTALALICRLLGILLLVYGILILTRSGREETRSFASGSRIAGIVLIIFGVLITVNPFFLVRISGTLLALFFLAYGIISLIRLIRADGQRGGKWVFCMAGAVFELIIGILLLASPVSASAAVLRIIGIVLLYAAVSALFYRSRPGTEGSTFTDGTEKLFRLFGNRERSYSETDINGKEIIEGTARDVTDDTDSESR